MNTLPAALLPLLLLFTGCAIDDTEPMDPPAPASGIPCDVEDVLRDRCQSCHGAEPIAGAPMPLMTWEDLQAPAVTNPTEAVWERMIARIDEETMPPPLSLDLDTNQTDLLMGYLRAGAPEDVTGSSCGAPPPPDAGTPSAACDGELHRFIAFGDGDRDSAYHVPSTVENQYTCFAFPSPFGAGDLASSFDVEIGDARVIHHLILYSTPVRPDADVFPCEEMPGDVNFVSGWAPGGGAIEMPEGVGAEVPQPTDWLILQAHYWNVAGHTDSEDRSGLTACVTNEPVDQVAAIVKLGNQGFEIPARTRDHVIAGDCETPAVGPARRVLGTASHMHLTGTRIATEIFRGGDSERSEDLVRITDWDFNTQGYVALEEEVWVDPGDTLRTTCVYDNDTDAPIRNGERTEDEMCLQFLLVVPAPPADTRSCIQRVP